MSLLSPLFAHALERYVEIVRGRSQEYYSSHYPSLKVPTFSVEPGKRFVRVVENNGQRMVHSFVDSSNGDVLKPEGWRKPAKHARGNIYSDRNGAEALAAGQTHVRYL